MRLVLIRSPRSSLPEPSTARWSLHLHVHCEPTVAGRPDIGSQGQPVDGWTGDLAQLQLQLTEPGRT
jgi:hypothetical protein